MSDDNNAIHMTNLNIRVSISVLVMRLIAVDLLAAFLLGLFYYSLVRGQEITNLALLDSSLFMITFIVLGILKILTTIYIILQWLNEYYEITKDAIVHKSGIIFRKVEHYNLANVRTMTITSGILGQMLNYGTITLFDLRMQKYLDMYLIHNPKRYIKVLEQLRPNIEFKKEYNRFIDGEENTESEEVI
ncbi:MAG: PH domain-containing protein [Candidatus Daviesbacteria bacterium]|nr:PH domain-containing protein [Candidatus Daviesbacteria bacterium]